MPSCLSGVVLLSVGCCCCYYYCTVVVHTRSSGFYRNIVCFRILSFPFGVSFPYGVGARFGLTSSDPCPLYVSWKSESELKGCTSPLPTLSDASVWWWFHGEVGSQKLNLPFVLHVCSYGRKTSCNHGEREANMDFGSPTAGRAMAIALLEKSLGQNLPRRPPLSCYLGVTGEKRGLW